MINFKIEKLNINVEYFVIVIFVICILNEKIFGIFYYFLACYLFIIFHELSHILVAIILGYEIKSFNFTLSGTYANILLDKNRFFVNSLIYFIGPISNFLLAYIFRQNLFIKNVNISLGVINLIPIYPLDGYKILINIILLIKNDKIFCYFLMKKIKYMFIAILVLIGFYEIIKYENFSILILFDYLVLININKEKFKT